MKSKYKQPPKNTGDAIIFRPQPGQQEAFLSTTADFCIYGGAAGGGKTYALLLEALRHANNPRFGAVIFRQSFAQITEEGALWDTAEEIYQPLGAIPKKSSLDWLFPCGSKIGFAHLGDEKAKYKYQGSQIPLICVEETTPIVMADGSNKPLAAICVGDEVQTLEGAKKVLWKGSRRLEKCVQVSLYNTKGLFVGSQIQSETHKVLTSTDWVSYADTQRNINLYNNCYGFDVQFTRCEYTLKYEPYCHPYNENIRQSKLALLNGLCWFEPCGERWVIDLTIADVSHYITTIGLVNKNCFDELTHFSESSIFYLFSRNRSTCGIRPYLRCTTNPDADSWIAEFIDWWLDEEGYPIQAHSGVIRYFIRASGEIIWGDSSEELTDRYPGMMPKSFTFIPAKIDDNQILMGTNPEYLANLQALHPIDQARLLYGNWKIKEEAGKLFNRTWFEIVDTVPPESEGYDVRFWDLAATEASVRKNACYTAGVRMRFVEGIYYIIDVIAERVNPVAGDELMLATAQQDGRWCMVRWELEGGSSGLRDEEHIKGLLAGFDAEGVRPLGDKVKRAKPLATDTFRGNVKLLRAAWNPQFISWMHEFPDGNIKDVTDAASGAHFCLNQISPVQTGVSYYTT